MKKLFLLGAALVLAGVVQASPDLIARVHFAGAEKVSADTNSAAFADEFCSAEARALENQTLDKISRAPYAWLKPRIVTGADDGAAQLRPLLDDFLKSEWVFEMRDTPNGSPEYALAIRLSNDRAQLWNKNLAAVLQSWTGIGISQDKTGIWELKKHLPPNLFEFSRWNDWVIIDCGQDKLSLKQGFIEEFERPIFANPLANWLEADLNWPRLGQLFPVLAKFDFPKIQMQAVGRGGDLHLDGKIISPQPFALTLDKWRLPTNTIHQPFISFTAARGIAPWLQRQGWAQPYLISPVPNQIFLWALVQFPFQVFTAVPVPDADAALVQLHEKLSAAMPGSGQDQFFMPFTILMTNREITLDGLLFAAPFVQAVRERTGDFLFGGMFPNSPRSKPLPPELFAALAPANLVYYHWEITAERLKMLLQPAQFTLMMAWRKQFDAESTAAKWLNHIGPTLDATVTEITQTAPNELTFTRKARGGLTAVELFALANWLEADNFPGCDLRLPPTPRAKPHSPKKTLSAPLPLLPH